MYKKTIKDKSQRYSMACKVFFYSGKESLDCKNWLNTSCYCQKDFFQKKIKNKWRTKTGKQRRKSKKKYLQVNKTKE